MNKVNYEILGMLMAVLALQVILLALTSARQHDPYARALRLLFTLTLTLTAIVVAALVLNTVVYHSFPRWISPGDLYAILGLGASVIAGLGNLAAAVMAGRERPGILLTGVLAGVYTLAVAGYCIYWENKLIRETPKYLSQPEVDTLYWLAESFDRVMKEHGIQYFIMSGTLLGAVRHGGLIQWDDDIDVGMFAADVDKLYSPAVKQALDDAGLYLENRHHMICNKVFVKGRRTPFVDIFTVELHEGMYRYQDAFARGMFPKEKFPQEFMFSPEGKLRNYDYGPLRLPGPYNGIGVVQQAYGADALTHYWIDDAHSDRLILLRRQHLKCKAPLTSETYAPRLPSSMLAPAPAPAPQSI